MNTRDAKSEAAAIRKWAEVGFDYAAVQGLKASLQQDKSESQGRAPKRTGKLAGTIRVVNPSSTAAGRNGFIKGGLAAGSRGLKGVPQAGVLQRGTVWGGGAKSKPHLITRRTGSYQSTQVSVGGGPSFGASAFVTGHLKLSPTFPRQVHHPGSKWPALDYLRVDAARASTQIDSALHQSADRDL
jgi:hypothetical protein